MYDLLEAFLLAQGILLFAIQPGPFSGELGVRDDQAPRLVDKRLGGQPRRDFIAIHVGPAKVFGQRADAFLERGARNATTR